MKTIADARLYTFVDTGYLRGRPVADLARMLCDGGSDIIQLRAKGLSPEEVRRMAGLILPVTAAAGVPLVINDHLPVALETGAQFCHLGQEDFFDVGYTRINQLPGVEPETLGGRRLRVGLSTHAPEQARKAIDAGADYVAIGPVYPTGTKPSARPVTLDYVRWAAATVRSVWFAIGGINLGTLDAVIEAGGLRVCVVSAILEAPDVTRACQQFKNRLLSAKP